MQIDGQHIAVAMLQREYTHTLRTVASSQPAAMGGTLWFLPELIVSIQSPEPTFVKHRRKRLQPQSLTNPMAKSACWTRGLSTTGYPRCLP